ncbi:MAG: hypothetical protein ACOC0P_01510 [Planctomycetota bacterium]
MRSTQYSISRTLVIRHMVWAMLFAGGAAMGFSPSSGPSEASSRGGQGLGSVLRVTGSVGAVHLPSSRPVVVNDDSSRVDPDHWAEHRPYAMIELPRLDDAEFFIPRAINDHGTMAATLLRPGHGGYDIFLIDEYGGMEQVPLSPQHPDAYPVGLNNSGVMPAFGLSMPINSGYWDAGHNFHVLAGLGGDNGGITDINESGVLVGSSNLAGPVDVSAAFIYQDGVMTHLPDLDPEGDVMTGAQGVNNAGVAVGYSLDPEVSFQWAAPVRWIDGEIERLPIDDPTGGSGYAYDINNEGIAVGFFSRKRDPDLGGRVACYWKPDGSVHLLPSRFERQRTRARMINDRGNIIGDTVHNDIKWTVSVVWDSPESTGIALRDLVPPEAEVGYIVAWDLNNRGQMVGFIDRFGNYDQGMFMTPVSYSFDLSSAVPGRAGEPNTVEVTNAPPNARVNLVAGTIGGGQMISGCSFNTNALQISNPRLVRSVITDADGNATITGTLDPNYDGRNILFQAYIADTCEISNLIVQAFE